MSGNDESSITSRLDFLILPLIKDVRTSLNSEYSVSFRYDDGWWLWTANWGDDLEVEGGVPEDAFEVGVAVARCSLARAVLEGDFDNVLTPWPPCPRHHDHPLDLRCANDRVQWWCSRDRIGLADLGLLNFLAERSSHED